MSSPGPGTAGRSRRHRRACSVGGVGSGAAGRAIDRSVRGAGDGSRSLSPPLVLEKRARAASSASQIDSRAVQVGRGGVAREPQGAVGRGADDDRRARGRLGRGGAHSPRGRLHEHRHLFVVCVEGISRLKGVRQRRWWVGVSSDRGEERSASRAEGGRGRASAAATNRIASGGRGGAASTLSQSAREMGAGWAPPSSSFGRRYARDK